MISDGPIGAQPVEFITLAFDKDQDQTINESLILDSGKRTGAWLALCTRATNKTSLTN